MPQRRLPTYLRAYRKRIGLSQAELARILGYKKDGPLSRLEAGKVLPSLFVAIACQIIFRAAIAELFPEAYERIVAIVEKRLADLEQELQQSSPKGRQIALVAHKLESLWERKQAKDHPPAARQSQESIQI